VKKILIVKLIQTEDYVIQHYFYVHVKMENHIVHTNKQLDNTVTMNSVLKLNVLQMMIVRKIKMDQNVALTYYVIVKILKLIVVILKPLETNVVIIYVLNQNVKKIKIVKTIPMDQFVVKIVHVYVIKQLNVDMMDL